MNEKIKPILDVITGKESYKCKMYQDKRYKTVPSQCPSCGARTVYFICLSENKKVMEFVCHTCCNSNYYYKEKPNAIESVNREEVNGKKIRCN